MRIDFFCRGIGAVSDQLFDAGTVCAVITQSGRKRMTAVMWQMLHFQHIHYFIKILIAVHMIIKFFTCIRITDQI